MGQYLGEMMVQLVIAEFLRVFKFSKCDENWEPNYGLDPLYSISNGVYKIELVD